MEQESMGLELDGFKTGYEPRGCFSWWKKVIEPSKNWDTHQQIRIRNDGQVARWWDWLVFQRALKSNMEILLSSNGKVLGWSCRRKPSPLQKWWSDPLITHTHTQTPRERERERGRDTHTHLVLSGPISISKIVLKFVACQNWMEDLQDPPWIW